MKKRSSKNSKIVLNPPAPLGRTVGIVAPSAAVSPVELELGVQKLVSAGFEVEVHRQNKKRHLFFAGKDQERAEAFYEFAQDPHIHILWAARGGYGAYRILPWLEKLTQEKGVPPKKLYVGYSDSTALQTFLKERWGWPTLHAPMPALREFIEMEGKDWKLLLDLTSACTPAAGCLGPKKLKFYGKAPLSLVEAELVGGNLSVWNTLYGTPYEPNAQGKILFLEEVSEPFYRVDRMIQHLAAMGGFEGVQALVLGTFDDCADSVPRVLKSQPKPKDLKRVVSKPRDQELTLLRPRMEASRALKEIFGEIGERFGIPVAYGLPTGHGGGYRPLPLGAQYRLFPNGNLELLSWDWQ